MEFWLLRRSITQRIGATGMSRRRLFTLWGAGILAGVLGLAVSRLWSYGQTFIGSALAVATFCLAYGLSTLALGVPEARAVLARVTRR
jgi:hypothetical protein